MVRAVSFDHAHHDRQLESSWTGAARIEQKNSVDHFIVRLVAVTEHDDVDRFLQQLGSKDVREKKSPAGDGDARNFVTVAIIIIPANERHRRDGAQRVQDVMAADVAGVEDRIHARQRLQRFRANQTVRVGDDADAWLRPRSKLSSPRSSSGSGP